MMEHSHTAGRGRERPVTSRTGRGAAGPAASRRRAGAPRPPRATGQAMVEFALMTPVFVLLMIGLIDVALLAKTHLSVVQASRAGAHQGAIAGKAADADTQIYNAIVAALLPGDKNQITQIRVFKFVAGSCEQGTESACQCQTIDPATGASTACPAPQSGWTSAGRTVLTDPPDILAAKITYQYSGLYDKLIPAIAALTISDQTVQRLERNTQ